MDYFSLNNWFAQPSLFLVLTDKILAWIFVAFLIVTIIFFVLVKITKHPIHKKLLKKIAYLSLTVGICGLLWFGLRYENTPIFSSRYWAGLIILGGVVWKVFVLKYLIWNFPTEKSEYDREQVKNKYIPRNK